jgi:hypothetical protein
VVHDRPDVGREPVVVERPLGIGTCAAIGEIDLDGLSNPGASRCETTASQPCRSSRKPWTKTTANCPSPCLVAAVSMICRTDVSAMETPYGYVSTRR